MSNRTKVPSLDCRFCGAERAVDRHLGYKLWHCFGCGRGGWLNDLDEPGAAVVVPDEENE